MRILVENINNITSLDVTKKVDNQDIKEQIFNYSINPPSDNLMSEGLWSDETKAILFEATKELQIGDFSPTILKTDNDAIVGAQKHLFGLIKYYEGDRQYYYEAHTTPYRDKYGNWTNGFGHLSNKKVTQEKAYEEMGKTLMVYAKEVKDKLNRILGKGTYENLPNSIKEGLIDLCYNKGINKIIKNKSTMNAIKNKDYSNIVKNLEYLYSGQSGAVKVEDPGLYRRSLNRAILSIRDLDGCEREEAKKVIDNLYNRALACHDKNKKTTTELNKIYENFKHGKISLKPYNAESYKFLVDASFKGKGMYAIAKYLYEKANDTSVTFSTFYNAIRKLNKDAEGKDIKIEVGNEVRVPFIHNISKNISSDNKTEVKSNENSTQEVLSDTSSTHLEQEPLDSENPESEIVEDGLNLEVPQLKVKDGADEIEKFDVIEDNGKITIKKSGEKEINKKDNRNIFVKAWDFVVNIFKSVSSFFKNLFSDKKPENNDEQHHITPFQRMLKEEGVKLEKAGDLLVASYDYKVQKGDNLTLLSQRYGTTVDKICKNNNIKDKNNIAIGQNIKIQKMAYKVKQGDNLFRISKKFGLTVPMLKDLNNIEDVDKINENQIIEIPGFIYKVEPKDTLYKISKQVGVTVDHLKSINKLVTDSIEPGQKIIVTYNDADYDVDSSRKIVTKDNKTQETKEVVTMGSGDIFKNRELLREKVKINGIVQATRKIYEPDSKYAKGPLAGHTILVNAGHGYSQAATDIGTPAIGNIDPEWLLNYDNAMRLKDKLLKKGAKVIFLQGHINIMQKELMKSKNKSDMVISIHVNAHDKKTQDRTQFYSYNGNGKLSNDSRRLAKVMEKNFDTWIPENEKISEKDVFTIKQGRKYVKDYAQRKEANLSMLRNGQKYQQAPSVLWEVAYMVSPKGRERMKDPKLMDNYADVMANSIVEYYNS